MTAESGAPLLGRLLASFDFGSKRTWSIIVIGDGQFRSCSRWQFLGDRCCCCDFAVVGCDVERSDRLEEEL